MVQYGNPRSGLEAGRKLGAAVFGASNGKRRGCIEWLFRCLLSLGEFAAQATGYCPERMPASSHESVSVSVIRNHSQLAGRGDKGSAFLL